jgi:DNA replication and repair protein RecF
VHLTRLHLRGWRNFAELRLELPAEGMAIVGDNGQGKTNLLEAIYYLEIFRSFRGAPDEQLVRFGEETFRVEAALLAPDGGERTLAAAFERRRKRKKVTLNGGEPERLADALGQVGAVIFSPADVELVSGAPGGRRRFLDIVLSLAEPGYLSALQRYRHALYQRNTLLRQGRARALVEAFDQALITAGTRVVAARARWVSARADGFAEHYARVAGGQPGEVSFVSSLSDEEEGGEGLEERFRAQLERAAEREQARGMTLVGPHRDELRFTTRGAEGQPLDLRVYGSGGQQRTAAIALRMVEAETIRESRGRESVILLDDVFAELDPGRSRRIIEWIDAAEGGQVILTAPKESDVRIHGGGLPRWSIRDGELRPG